MVKPQDVHREYGGLQKGGVLCTCPIGEDHSELGIRLRHAEQSQIVSAGTTLSCLEALRDELDRWASQFQAYADTLREETRSMSTGSIVRARTGAESVTWTQAAQYLRSRANWFREECNRERTQEGS